MYSVVVSLILVALVVPGIVLSLVGALDLSMSVSRLVRSVVHSVDVDTDIGVGLLRGPLYLVVGVLLLAISLGVSESLENIYYQIEDAFLQ
jgi:Ca2+/Na+ antiporter